MNIHEMKLHERVQIGDGLYIFKVPGGWIYSFFNGNVSYRSVFVPYNEEFKVEIGCDTSEISGGVGVEAPMFRNIPFKLFDEFKSSNIERIGYSLEGRILFVEFLGGSKYFYNDISIAVYDNLKGAESVGKHFNANIKNNFAWKKLGDKEWTPLESRS